MSQPSAREGDPILPIKPKRGLETKALEYCCFSTPPYTIDSVGARRVRVVGKSRLTIVGSESHCEAGMSVLPTDFRYLQRRSDLTARHHHAKAR